MLALKLFLVPFFLWLLTMAGRRWGAAVAGWLAGLPVVAGPILGFLAIEQGAAFAAGAASAALSAVFASVSFNVAYAWSCGRSGWPAALVSSLVAWLAAASVLSLAPAAVAVSLSVALATLLIAPSAFPPHRAGTGGRSAGASEVGWRMVAGATLTLAVTWLASDVGARWSGLLAVFPVIGIVLATFSHRTEGPAFAATLLRATIRGLYAFCAFCFTLALALPRMGMGMAFALAVAASLAAQFATRRGSVAATARHGRPGPR